MRCRQLPIVGVLALSASSVLAQPITYQGRLTDQGQPASASYDVQFRLYSLPVGGLQIASATQTVDVLDGFFTAMPEFAAGTFTSATMYLEVAIRPAGSIGLYTPLSSGRQRITPTPLAFESLGDRWTLQNATTIRTDPGIATVLINTAAPVRADSVLTASRTTASSGELAGIVVNNTLLSGRSFFAWATASETRGEAIVSGAGEFWLNLGGTNAIDILPAGMIGLGVSANAADRLRVNGNTSIQGTLSATSVNVADTLAAGDVNAVNVSASSAVSSPSYRYPANQTRYYNVCAEELRPMNSDVTYYLNGGNFYVDAAVAGAYLVAPVHLPDGATITNVEMLCYDNVAEDISFKLWRRLPADTGYFVMTTGTSTGTSVATRTVNGGTITTPVVDESYIYMVAVYCADWPGSSLFVKNVQIRYNVAGPN